MKLQRVEFVHPVTIRGHGAAADWDSARVTLTYDPDTDMVAIGDDGDEFPRSAVLRWKRERSKEPPQVKPRCHLCGREFNNAQALGGHMGKKHAKETAA